MNCQSTVLLTALLFCSQSALAQSPDKEPAAIIELGGASAVNLKDATPSAGPTLTVEVTPIENLRLVLPCYSAVAPQNGASTFYSRSLGLCPKK
jgi:hypothetical protein